LQQKEKLYPGCLPGECYEQGEEKQSCLNSGIQEVSGNLINSKEEVLSGLLFCIIAD
jgi:hypothetical protein